MASNFSFVFIENKKEIDINHFLDKIEFNGYSPVEEVDLWDTSKPDTLFIGKHNGYLIFADEGLPYLFFKETRGKMETRFVEYFPDSEISAFFLNESTGMFGFAIIKNGERKRILLGGDGEIHLELGEKLSIENQIVRNEIFDEDTLKEMRENGEDIERLILIEASYRVTGQLISERLGRDFYTLKDKKVTLFRYE